MAAIPNIIGNSQAPDKIYVLAGQRFRRAVSPVILQSGVVAKRPRVGRCFDRGEALGLFRSYLP